jgi:hypothetical protein
MAMQYFDQGRPATVKPMGEGHGTIEGLFYLPLASLNPSNIEY